jgi:hypothetical protein
MIKKKTAFLLIIIATLTLMTLACLWFPSYWIQLDYGKPSEETDGQPAGIPGQEDADRCSALEEVKISLEKFSEETFDSEGGTECAYSHQISNEGEQPVILVYYDHFFYGENPPPNDYEFGWNLTSPVQPGESRTLDSFTSDYPKQPLYLDQVISLAVIYDSPDCDWLIAGGIHREILEIAVEEPLQAPCTLVSPPNDPGAAPDLSDGLIKE